MFEWWHRKRAAFWELEYCYCVGWIERAIRRGTHDQWEMQMAEANKMIAHGKTMYHRLKAGLPA